MLSSDKNFINLNFSVSKIYINLYAQGNTIVQAKGNNSCRNVNSLDSFLSAFGSSWFKYIQSAKPSILNNLRCFEYRDLVCAALYKRIIDIKGNNSCRHFFFVVFLLCPLYHQVKCFGVKPLSTSEQIW